MIVDVRDDQHQDPSCHSEEQLPRQIVEWLRIGDIDRLIVACTEDHRYAEQRKHNSKDEDYIVVASKIPRDPLIESGDVSSDSLALKRLQSAGLSHCSLLFSALPGAHLLCHLFSHSRPVTRSCL